jgi:hypothetical protein
MPHSNQEENMNLKPIAAALAIAFPGLASAGSVAAQVLDVTAENMPNYVAFKLSWMPAECQPPNYYFAFWSSNPETVKAVYAMLLAAVLSGKSVWVVCSGCQVSQVHGVF